MKISLNVKICFLVTLMFLMFVPRVKAATLELSLEKDIISAKEDIAVIVVINSENQNINTAQATITFPANLLEVLNIDTTGSVFSFWLQEPVFDNTKGTISFVGGSTSSFNGPSLRIMRVAFKVKGSGTGRLGVTNAAINSSDGTGSNVYTTSKGLDINIPATAEFQAVKIEQARAASTLAQALPQVKLNIPFYPDPTKWNNRSASFNATWNISSDTIAAGVALNSKPNFTPDSSTEALSGSQVFSALTDGVWYLHVRLSNNIGWTPTIHYRIAVDTAPPIPFNITSDSGFVTSEPAPTINFVGSDLTSGINNYVIHIDNKTATTTSLTSYKFQPLLPGVHQLTISAFDKAGNSTSETKSLEILPIASPLLTYYTHSVIADEGEITAGGTASVGVEVIVQIQDAQKQFVAEQIVPIDSNGNWNVTISKILIQGDYHLLVTARDAKKASSFPVISETIVSTERPILVIGRLEITSTWFFIDLIIILLASFGAGWFSYHNWREQLGRKVTISQRDVVNVTGLLKNDIDKLLKKFNEKDFSESKVSEIEYLLKDMKNNIEKSKRYITDDIRELNS